VTAARARDAFADVARAIEERQAELDRLDAVTGDGDHGATMVMGLRAVTAALPEDEDSVAELLRIAAGRFASVGGTTGPLWGTALLRAAQSLGGAGATDLPAMAAAVAAAAQGIADRGRCVEGDKTLLDVMGPASRALSRRRSHRSMVAVDVATGRRTRRPTTSSTSPDSTSSTGPPTRELARAPTMAAGSAPASARRATTQSMLPWRECDQAPAAEPGSRAGSGPTTAAMPGTPSRASIGVANAEPTPKVPYSSPITEPPTTIHVVSTTSSWSPARHNAQSRCQSLR